MTATPTPDDGAAGCRCRKCLDASGVKVWWMVVCQKCGNKRCPHATNHEHACTNSNEPGQIGAPSPTRSPAPVSGELEARVKELEGVLRYIIEYGERSGLKRVQQVCDMTLKGMDMSPLRQEPTQHCAGAGREGGV